MGFAALCIYVTHEWIPLFSGVPVLGRFEDYIYRTVFFGVDIFFFLSGMGLVFARKKESLGRFYLQRVKRILVSPIVLLLLMLFIDRLPLGEGLLSFSGYYFFTRSIYSFLWFFHAILMIYLLFPAYYLFFDRSKNKFLFTAGALAVWLLLSVALKGIMREDMYGFTNRIPVFLLGVLFAWSRDRIRIRSGPAQVLALCGILACGVFLAWKTSIKGMYFLVPVSNCCIPNLLLTVSVVPLLSILMNTRIFHGVPVKILTFFGGITYEMYCLQEWMGAKIRPFLASFIRFPAVVGLLNFALTVLAAFLLHLLTKLLLHHLEQMVSGPDRRISDT